jgi:hypothetical protein
MTNETKIINFLIQLDEKIEALLNNKKHEKPEPKIIQPLTSEIIKKTVEKIYQHQLEIEPNSFSNETKK